MKNLKEEISPDGVDGAANLLSELNKIFEIYTAELKAWRESKGKIKGVFLLDEDMFDIVIKLLDKADKILKLSQKDGNIKPVTETAKIRNIQDVALNKKD